MTRLGKIRYNGKIIQIFLTDNLKRNFMVFDGYNHYYKLEAHEYNELQKLFSYNNKLIANSSKKGFISTGFLLFLASSVLINQSKTMNIQNYSYNEIVESLYNNDSIDMVLENNKNLDTDSRMYINNFINQIGDDFDLTLFKANLKDLKIQYLDETEFNKVILKEKLQENTVAFFEPYYCIIYINNEYRESIYHELFHAVNIYRYNTLMDFSYNDIDGKGTALLEGMTAYYTKKYFNTNSYCDEVSYVAFLAEIVGEEKIKYYFEKGNLEDTINDLKKLYGDEKTANKLIMMMDDNLMNRTLIGEEGYKDNVDQIIFLLQDYYYGSHEKQLEDIVRQLEGFDIATKRNVTELLLNVFFEKANIWEMYFSDYDQRNSYKDKKVKSLSNFYNILVKYNIYENKEDYLDLVSHVNEEHEDGKYVLYDYDDIKNCLNLTDENVITEEVVKAYVKE